MAEDYPQFTFERDVRRSRTSGLWCGWVQPVKAPVVPNDLLDDLSHDRPVFVAGDEVRHVASCKSVHCHHEWMAKVADLTRRFELLIEYNGGTAVPRCRVESPIIPFEKRRHMWGDGSVCAFLASESVWVWSKDTVASFLPHVLIWLVKWMVFDDSGVWIGSEHRSDPGYHLQFLDPRGPCWCGSGSPYRRCHRRQDLALLRKNRHFLGLSTRS